MAILGTPLFDTGLVDGSSLRLGVDGDNAMPLYNGNLSDVNFDGLLDYVAVFPIQDLGIDPDSPAGTIIPLKLTGKLLNGFAIDGMDYVIVWYGRR